MSFAATTIEMQEDATRIWNLSLQGMIDANIHKFCFLIYIQTLISSAVGCPLGKDPSGFRIVNVSEDRISHNYVPFRDSPDVGEI